MKYIYIGLITLLSTSICSYAQDSTQLKRTPYKLTVAVDKKTFYEEQINETPYVLPDRTVQLYPGETVYIEVEQENGNIKSMTSVKEIKNPSITITITFSQNVKKNVHESTMLKIVNPFTYELIYKAKIFLLRQKKWGNTDVYPVEPGLSAIELWPDIITSIALGDWTFKVK